VVVWRRMKKPTVSLAFLLLALLAACSAGAAPPSATPATTPSLTAPPDEPVTGAGGSDPGQAGEPQPQLVVARPGQRNLHDVNVNRLQGQVLEGGRVIVRATFYSGIEPCSVLDSVRVIRDGDNFTITLRQGTGKGDVACIDIALLKATDIELGVLPAGTYTIQARPGDAAAIQVTVS
jgi:ABC-type transport system substrate-binding protein